MADETKDKEPESVDEQSEETADSVKAEAKAPKQKVISGPPLFPAVAIVGLFLVALAVGYVVVNTVLLSFIWFIIMPTLATLALAVWWYAVARVEVRTENRKNGPWNRSRISELLCLDSCASRRVPCACR